MSVNEKMTAIADAIRSKTGGTEKLGLDAMASSIGEVYDNGRSDGFSEGYSDGYDNGHSNGYSGGYDEGKQAEYDYLWNGIQQNGNRTNYDTCFKNWASIVEIKPKYQIKASRLYETFLYCQRANKIPDDVIPSNNVAFTHLYQAFAYCSALEEINFDLPINAGADGFNSTFRDCKKLKTIKKIILDGKTYGWGYCFYMCEALENIAFEGDIKAQASISLAESKVLSDASVQNIIDHLFDYTGDTTRTLTLHPDVKERVEADNNLVAQITSKNWTLA